MIFTHMLLFTVGVATAEQLFTLTIEPTHYRPGDWMEWFQKKVEWTEGVGFVGQSLNLWDDTMKSKGASAMFARGSSSKDQIYMIDAATGNLRGLRSGGDSWVAGVRPNNQASSHSRDKEMYRLEFFPDAEIPPAARNLTPETDVEVLTKWRYHEYLEDRTPQIETRSFLLGLEQEGGPGLNTKFYLCNDGDKRARVYHVDRKALPISGPSRAGCQQVRLMITWLPIDYVPQSEV